MKNQCFGDVTDYGKYGLLRFLAKGGIKIGINWYLLEDDNSNDGKKIEYLEKDKERWYDETLFDFLKKAVATSGRDVKLIEGQGLIEQAIFYHKILTRKNRMTWHEEALACLKTAELVFLDADKGTIGDKKTDAKDSGKYIIPTEIIDYYKRGQNVVYCCQKGRRKYVEWERIKGEILEYLPDAKLCVLTYGKGQKCTYIFVIHPKDYKRYINIIYKFQYSGWGRVFQEEYIDGKNPANVVVGEPFIIPLSNGVEMSMKLQQDGKICVQFSDQTNMNIVLEADQFARYIRT